MKLSILALVAVIPSAAAFAPAARRSQVTSLHGYLDDLSKELYAEDPNPVPEEDTKEATDMKAEDKDRFGVGNWEGYVEFNEFDGGDGQMGVAGDGNSKLESFDMSEVGKSLQNSRSMSAKNAWGRATGYAEELTSKGVDTQRAQQLENWHSQQEVLNQRKSQQQYQDSFDNHYDEDDNWRNLATFGVERNQVCIILTSLS